MTRFCPTCEQWVDDPQDKDPSQCIASIIPTCWSQAAVSKYHYVIHCFADVWWVEDRLSGRRTAVFRYPEGVDRDTISDWFNGWLDLYFIASDSLETEERQNFTEPGNGSMTGSA